jgi:hypothetical protein
MYPFSTVLILWASPLCGDPRPQLRLCRTVGTRHHIQTLQRRVDSDQVSDENQRVPVDSLPVTGRPRTLYRTDLGWSARALVEAPGLVLSTVVLLLISEAAFRVQHVGLLIAIPIALVLAGFAGTQRVWFVRVMQGAQKLGGREVLVLTRSFIGRFVVLGLVASIPAFPIGFVLALLTWRTVASGAHIAATPSIADRITLIAYSIALDVALTFVVPALALSFRSTKRALWTGLHVIRETWPQCAWYVIAPGLTLTAFTGVLPASVIGPWLALAMSIIGGILGLWFKGAVVAFYVRVHPAEGYDGAAYF